MKYAYGIISYSMNHANNKNMSNNNILAWILIYSMNHANYAIFYIWHE